MKKKTGCLVGLTIIISLFVLLCVIVGRGVKDVEDHPEKYDDFIAAKYINVTNEESKAIDDILNKCGISKVNEFKHDKLLDNAHEKGETGCRINCDCADNVILYLNKKMKVHSLVYADNKLYAKNKVKATLQEFTFSADEATRYQSLCEDKVKAILKSPNTAKFPNIMEWGFGKTKKEITVQEYVDAENSFGAETRSNFQFIFDKETDSIKSFIFDGKEQIQ